MSTEVFIDSNGVPVEAGDLLRTYHFHDCTAHRKKRYLYHVVCVRDGKLEERKTVAPRAGKGGAQ